jgi:glutathione S-transferase
VAHLLVKNPEYQTTIVPEYYSVLDHYYTKNAGPYLLGDKLSYVDFVVFQSIYDNKKTGNDIVSFNLD